ncbi:MAG: DUF3343 domain-containing protein [Oscillospiraceae bacterium]|nr:DUF3343 domain-containing protein [Oscillospiraceae bacterium]
MEELLFTGKSATHAQMMKRVLDKSGIAARIVRPDINITHGNCSYAVKISQMYFGEAVEVLKRSGIMPVRAVLVYGNGYREISI